MISHSHFSYLLLFPSVPVTCPLYSLFSISIIQTLSQSYGKDLIPKTDKEPGGHSAKMIVVNTAYSLSQELITTRLLWPRGWAGFKKGWTFSGWTNNLRDIIPRVCAYVFEINTCIHTCIHTYVCVYIYIHIKEIREKKGMSQN